MNLYRSSVGSKKTDRSQNCGNILAGVVPFAIESGLIKAGKSKTRTRIYMTNSGSICEVVLNTPNGQVEYAGDARIDGVPGTAAPIICNYIDIAGSITGSLFPTGNKIDVIDEIEVSCIDNGMPVVIIRAKDLERTGYESRDDLNGDDELKERLERIRMLAGPLMNLDDVTDKVVPINVYHFSTSLRWIN